MWLYCSGFKMATRGCCHSNGTTVMPLLQSLCLCNVPIAWYSSRLFHGAVGFWGPGLSRECTLGCVQSLGGMKSKGNTHQDSCIVQCPCCHSNGTTVIPLLQSQCLCNVPIDWYSSGLFHGAVGFWGPGPSREHTMWCVQSLGGMKSKGNTHQDSCIVQCPTFLSFLCGNPPGFQLFQSLAPSKWVLYTYRLPQCNN